MSNLSLITKSVRDLLKRVIFHVLMTESYMKGNRCEFLFKLQILGLIVVLIFSRVNRRLERKNENEAEF